MNILKITSSIRGETSHSNHLAQLIVARLINQHPSARDLVRQPHPALDEFTIQALWTPLADRSPAQAERVALDDALIAEVQAADVIVIAVPMYNFAIPVQLQTWIDAIARAGVTFRYTEQGPEGLLIGKRVYLALTRGGIYRDTPTDTQVPYLKTVLGFLGMTDVRTIYAEGLAMGHEQETQAFQLAAEALEDCIA
jgi:FMN-dependent NADH-azoreductase